MITKQESKPVGKATIDKVFAQFRTITSKKFAKQIWHDSKDYVYKVEYDETKLTASEITAINDYLLTIGCT